MELPPQRFSRPSQSTALPPILNFYTAGLSNLRFCSLPAPGGAAHHSFALDCADACLADSYARPSQSTAATTHPKLFSAGLSNLWFCSLPAPTAWVENFGYYTVSKSDCQFICYADYYTCEPERACYHYPQRGNIKGHHTW